MPTEDQLRRARTLVLDHGWNATGYQILNPGIDLWFSERSDAVIGYVRHRRMLVVAGAPVCALDQLAAVGDEFAEKMEDLTQRHSTQLSLGLKWCFFPFVC